MKGQGRSRHFLFFYLFFAHMRSTVKFLGTNDCLKYCLFWLSLPQFRPALPPYLGFLVGSLRLNNRVCVLIPPWIQFFGLHSGNSVCWFSISAPYSWTPGKWTTDCSVFFGGEIMCNFDFEEEAKFKNYAKWIVWNQKLSHEFFSISHWSQYFCVLELYTVAAQFISRKG